MSAMTRDRGLRSSPSPLCTGCGLQSDCFLTMRIPEEQGDCKAVVQRRTTLRSGARLFGRETPFGAVFVICRGSVKTQRVTPEGGLVVSGFYLPGDLLGLEAIGDELYPYDAIATSDTEVCRLDFERLIAFCSRKPGMHAWVISRIALYMRRKEADQSWARSLQTDRRVLKFFLGLFDRLTSAARPSDAPTLPLPMKKQDIAWYLQITPETLSRNLALLRREGLLLVDHDRFALPDLTRAYELTRI